MKRDYKEMQDNQEEIGKKKTAHMSKMTTKQLKMKKTHKDSKLDHEGHRVTTKMWKNSHVLQRNTK